MPVYINEKFLNYMFTNLMHFKGTTETTFMVKEPQGSLVVTQGRLVLSDPYAINYGVVVSEEIPNGQFPVTTFTAHLEPHDEVKVAGFLLQFDEEARPDHWKMCLPQNVKEEDVPQDGYYGVSTESGNIAVCAQQTVGWLLEHLEASSDVLDDIEKQLGATYFANGGVANAKLPDIDANIITMVGEPGQAFPAYWGYQDGKVVCMAIDFLVVD